MRTTKELREMVNSGPAFGFTGRLVINDILDRLDALAVDAATPHLEPPSHFVETIHLEGVDYVKLEDYMALAKTIGDGSKAIDVNEALRRLAMLARDYMTGSETGEADVDKYAKIVSAALSSNPAAKE